MCILQVPTEQVLNMELKPPLMFTSDVAFKYNSNTLLVFFIFKKLLKINTCYIHTHRSESKTQKVKSVIFSYYVAYLGTERVTLVFPAGFM